MFTEHFDYLYVEPSSFCNLKCPRCPRTFKGDSYRPQHLDVDLFQEFISSKLWESLDTIEYGGNLGDPLMHPKFKELFELTRQICPRTHRVIHTSGNQSPKWWNNFSETLSPNDTVLFSIDGLENSNSTYRVGARWDWILEGMKSCIPHSHTIWKFIVFKHNEDQILESIKTARDLGIEKFLLTKSHIFFGKWSDSLGDDPLAPHPQWIAKKITLFDVFAPKCQSSSRHYLSATGEYSPCCWTEPNKLFRFQVTKENAKDTFGQIMSDYRLKEIKSTWPGSADDMCLSKCRQTLGTRSSHQQLQLSLKSSLSEIKEQLAEFASQQPPST